MPQFIFWTAMTGEEKQFNLIFSLIISIAETTLKAGAKADKNVDW